MLSVIARVFQREIRRRVQADDLHPIHKYFGMLEPTMTWDHNWSVTKYCNDVINACCGQAWDLDIAELAGSDRKQSPNYLSWEETALLHHLFSHERLLTATS